MRGGPRAFALADVLGVDRETGETICTDVYPALPLEAHFIRADTAKSPAFHNHVRGVHVLNGRTQVLFSDGNDVIASANNFGKGRAVYLSGFQYSSDNARLLYRALLYLADAQEMADVFLPEDARCECAYYPQSGRFVWINNSAEPIDTRVATPWGVREVSLAGEGIAIEDAPREA